MPRIARRNLKSCYQHIMVQGINKEYIFNRREYIQKYLEIISDKLKESNLNILAYCIMNNHAHFLIYSESSEILSKFMQRVDGTYSNFYNKVNNRVGYVFRNRYKSQDILSQRQLYICLKYIHNNPVKAQIVKSMDKYRYSSYNEFLGQKYIITDKSLKLLFGSSTNFVNQFFLIHNNYPDEGNFLEVKEKEIQTFIKEIEEKYHKKVFELKDNKNILIDIIKQARRETDVTIIELAEILGVSKSFVGDWYRK